MIATSLSLSELTVGGFSATYVRAFAIKVEYYSLITVPRTGRGKALALRGVVAVGRKAG